ncbi:dihydrofolate reductase family protein [Candidatus Enterococcus ikei]|uniref:Dihydrofolate reductase n=1 Tax=Candidatus Enterococcus ikei TaxID=2815326 RepID=A0ABS3GXP4_9ENTE|nr:dihydrofolate reductase family protein [Enterococcus sp. DIV0869a]MBO0440017.1 dihydrofolate reductase [Enterococcus sp. DIV0869a]
MSREVILYIAASLDGYIAEPDGSIDFLGGGIELVEEDTSYQELMEKIDTVVMGRTTYDQVVNELSPEQYPYEEQTSYIITSHPDASTEKLIFTSQNPAELIQELKEQEGQAIWVVGGGSIIAPLVEANLIDTYILTTIPTILGNGIPLFNKLAGPVNLKVDQVYVKNNMVYTTYSNK